MYIYDRRFTHHFRYDIDKKTQANKITQLSDTNILESTWEYKITNK